MLRTVHTYSGNFYVKKSINVCVCVCVCVCVFDILEDLEIIKLSLQLEIV